MHWLHNLRSRAPKPPRICQLGAPTPESAVQQFILSLPDTGPEITFSALGMWQAERLFVFGGPSTPSAATPGLMVGYLLVAQRAHGWKVRQSATSRSPAAHTPLVIVQRQLPGALLVHGYVRMQGARAVDLVADRGQPTQVVLTSSLFGALLPSTRMLRTFSVVP